MAYCRNCGSFLPEGKRFCPECGQATSAESSRAVALPPPEPYYPLRQQIPAAPAEKPRRKRKSLFRRWWFWLLVIAAAASLWNRSGGFADKLPLPWRSAPTAASAPRSTPRPAARPTATPTAPSDRDESEESPAPEAAETPLAQSDIRPEFKEFLDSYEEFMDEYVTFMQKYSQADSSNALGMLMDYYDLLERELAFSEKLDAMDESDYTSAEWAYYLEVTSRVSQKLLRALG